MTLIFIDIGEWYLKYILRYEEKEIKKNLSTITPTIAHQIDELRNPRKTEKKKKLIIKSNSPKKTSVAEKLKKFRASTSTKKSPAKRSAASEEPKNAKRVFFIVL